MRGQVADERRDAAMMNTVEDVLDAKGSREVYAVPETATLAEIIRTMCEKNVGALMVTDAGGDGVGIVSERDVLHQCNRRADFAKTLAKDVMTSRLVEVSVKDDIHVAMDLVIRKKIRHLPVRGEKRIVGIITVRDLVYGLQKADEDDQREFIRYLQESIGPKV
jgi:CBS domain-containing protein